MISVPPSRWVIIGNSGSGKSTLAEQVGTALHLPVYDLDLIHWHQGGRKRDEAEAKADVADIARTGAWVIEGVYGWLTGVALPKADVLVWLDLPWDDCRNGLLARGLRRGMTPNDQEALLVWAEGYWTRTTTSSFTGHESLYREFTRPKTHLRTREEVAAFMKSGLG